MRLDIAEMRRRAENMRYVRGDEGGEYVSQGWAEMVVDDTVALCDRVEALEEQLAEQHGNPLLCVTDNGCGMCEPCQLRRRVEALEAALRDILPLAERWASGGHAGDPEDVAVQRARRALEGES